MTHGYKMKQIARGLDVVKKAGVKASDILGAIAGLVVIERETQGAIAELKQIVVDATAAAQAIAQTSGKSKGEGIRAKHERETLEKIMIMAGQRETITVKDAHAEVGTGTLGKASYWLKKLVLAGRVEWIGRGTYRIRKNTEVR